MQRYLLIFFLVFLFIITFIPRLYRLENPIADWHSWRQADTAAVTRNFVQEGFTPFYPKFDTMNSLNEGSIPNPKRYFFAEFPLYNIIQYESFKMFGHLPIHFQVPHLFTFDNTLEDWGRIISIISASLTTIVLYFLVLEYSSRRVAIFASIFFAILPYNIYYGRVIMPDPLHILLSVLTLFLITKTVQKDSVILGILSGVVYAGALLTKPYALIYLLPIGYVMFMKWKFSAWKKIIIYLFLVISLIPLYLWRNHIQQYPEGMFATNWLFNQGNIRFTGAYFRWLIYDRMNRLIFATGGFVLFWLGIIVGYTKKEGLFYYMWLVSILAFFVIIARGNVTHDYYQMPLVPIGCIFMAKGADFLLNFGQTTIQLWINRLTLVVLVLLMVAFGWFEVRDYFNINNPAIVLAGKYVDSHLPKNATVITPYQNDPAFLYQTNRIGWTVGDDKIAEFKSQGADYLVSVNYDDSTNYWMKKCTITEKNKDFVIVNLKECK